MPLKVKIMQHHGADNSSERYNANWSDAAPRYQSTIGAISASSAFELVRMADNLTSLRADSYILDVGCGPGAVTLAIVAQEPTAYIEAIDTSEAMLSDLLVNLRASGVSKPRVNASKVDLHNIASRYATTEFSHVFASYVLHVAAISFAKSVADMYEVLKPGGVLAIATFTPHSDPYLVWDRVCRIYDADFVAPDYSPDPHSWTTPGQIAAGLYRSGFVEIKTVVRRAPFPIHSVDEWTDFFFGGKNPAGELVVQPFFATHDVAEMEVRNTFKGILRDEWDGGKNILMEFILAVGQKPTKSL